MSTEIVSKAEWLDRIERGRATWEALVSEVPGGAMDRPGFAGDWSFKDVAGHLNGWRDLTVNRLEAALDDAVPITPWPDGMSEETPEGVDVINQWIYARYRDQPIEVVLAETREQFRRIRSAVEAMPESLLETRFSWLEGYPLSAVIAGSLEHLHEDHEPEIRAWLSAHAGRNPSED